MQRFIWFVGFYILAVSKPPVLNSSVAFWSPRKKLSKEFVNVHNEKKKTTRTPYFYVTSEFFRLMVDCTVDSVAICANMCIHCCYSAVEAVCCDCPFLSLGNSTVYLLRLLLVIWF